MRSLSAAAIKSAGLSPWWPQRTPREPTQFEAN